MNDLPSPAEMVDLDGRVVVVTGAGGNIGSGIARRLVAAGATVVAHTRSSPVDHLRDRSGEPLHTVVADLATASGPRELVKLVVRHLGRLDALVNNAGVQPVAPFAELTDDQWSEMIDTNLTAVHRLTQAAAAAMETRGAGGSIVHISSIEGSNPAPGHGHYSVSKAALIMHARAAALTYGPSGIRVNTVSPGLISRPGIVTEWPEGVRRWREACPLERLGTPEDIGDACVFLCSDLARWITGANLVVDGGVLSRPTW
ncbi:MAG: SDR family NAD(P)-dependent oxidoreductase [bacterium]|nr:SDR family NAD(P)-dependent oxidoreductase [bacterium]MDE0289071.1 SDR family NAD(P)-dependent oxidoreductase [bacterium]MDE0439377.1 SDR family NAD(P)-dependent oxidoreductase [bacterium]